MSSDESSFAFHERLRTQAAAQRVDPIACCPTCKRPLNLALPKRFCAACGQQITRYHKWQIGDDCRIRHRVCERPDSYQ